MGSGTLFNRGDAIKLLKDKLRFKTGLEIITGDSDNPTSVAKDAPLGSVYLQSSTNVWFVKQDAGSSTNWSEIVDTELTQTLLNKTLTNPLISTNGAIDVDAAGTLSIGSSMGANDLTLGSATGNVQISNTLTLNQDAIQPLEAASKQQLDAAIDGVQRKQSVVVRTTADITLSGEQTVNGVLTSTSRVLVMNQSDQTENGIYVSDASAWSRSIDANSSAELNHAITSVQSGTAFSNTAWEQQTDNPSIGADNIIWFQAYGAGTYVADETSLTLNGAIFSVKDLGVTDAKVATGIDAAKLADGSVSNTEFQHINSLTSNAQTQLDARVVGPASATDEAIAIYDSTTGKIVKNSLVTIDTSGNIATPGTVDGRDVAFDGEKNDFKQSTSLLTGGDTTANVDTTQVDISAGVGTVADAFSDPLNPTFKEITFGPFIGQTVPNLGDPGQFIWIEEDLPGNPGTGRVAFTAPLSGLEAAQYRDKFLVGVTVHAGGAISGINDITFTLSAGLGHQIQDLMTAIGVINTEGNVFGPASTDLTVSKTAGKLFFSGSNYKVAKDNPSEPSVASIATVTMIPIYKDGGGGFTFATPTTDIVPGSYDDGTGGVGTPNGSVGNNQWSVHRLYILQNGTVFWHYGQDVYGSQSDAVDGITTESFEASPLLSTVLFRSYILVKGNATNLSLSAQAQFIAAGKFGGSTGAGATAAVTDLQTAYENGIDPEIELNTTRGTLSIVDASTPIGVDLFEISNNALSTQFLVVDVNGIGGDGITASFALTSDANSRVKSSAVTTTELEHLTGVTSNVQTQLTDNVTFSITSSSGVFTATVNETHLVNTSGGVATITLPAAVTDTFVRIKDKGNANTNNITVNTPGAETIDGAASDIIDSDFASIVYVSDGTNWFKL